MFDEISGSWDKHSRSTYCFFSQMNTRENCEKLEPRVNVHFVKLGYPVLNIAHLSEMVCNKAWIY